MGIMIDNRPIIRWTCGLMGEVSLQNIDAPDMRAVVGKVNKGLGADEAGEVRSVVPLAHRPG